MDFVPTTNQPTLFALRCARTGAGCCESGNTTISPTSSSCSPSCPSPHPQYQAVEGPPPPRAQSRPQRTRPSRPSGGTCARASRTQGTGAGRAWARRGRGPVRGGGRGVLGIQVRVHGIPAQQQQPLSVLSSLFQGQGHTEVFPAQVVKPPRAAAQTHPPQAPAPPPPPAPGPPSPPAPKDQARWHEWCGGPISLRSALGAALA